MTTCWRGELLASWSDNWRGYRVDVFSLPVNCYLMKHMCNIPINNTSRKILINQRDTNKGFVLAVKIFY